MYLQRKKKETRRNPERRVVCQCGRQGRQGRQWPALFETQLYHTILLCDIRNKNIEYYSPHGGHTATTTTTTREESPASNRQFFVFPTIVYSSEPMLLRFFLWFGNKQTTPEGGPADADTGG